MSAMLKLILIIAFSFNSLGAVRWVWSTYYGNGDDDAHYDILSKNDGNGGVTIRVTTRADGNSESSTVTQINAYYLVKMKVGASGSWATVQFSGDNSTQGQWQMGGDLSTNYTKAITHAAMAQTTGYAEADNSELHFKLLCNSGCSANNEIALTRPDGNAHLDFDVVAPTVSSVTIASNNSLGAVSNASIKGGSYDFRQYARKDDIITLTYTGSEAFSVAPTVTIAGSTADATNVANTTDWTSTETVTSTQTEGLAAISIASFKDTIGNTGVTNTTINTCTNCTASVTVDRTVPTVDSATMASTTHDGTQQTTGFVNDEDEISLAVVFSEEIVSTPVITVSSQATATTTAAGNTSWSYTRELGTAESNNALLAISIDANSGTPATSVLDVAGNYLAGDYTTAPTGQLYYDRTHPSIGTVTIASNNGISTARAKPTNVVTVSATGSENLHASPTMTVEGTAATVTQGANATLWTGTVAMSEAAHTDDDAVELTVDCYDKSGNSCTQATATTDGSAVDYNETVPVMENVTISSNNANNDYATTGDIISLVFEDTNETTTLEASVAVTIAGATVAGGNITENTSNAKYTAAYTMAGTETEGVIPFTVNLTDLHGNAMTEVTAEAGSGVTDDPASVTYDKTAPGIGSLSIACNTNDAECTEAGFAKDGSEVVVTLTANENLDGDTDATGSIMSINAAGGNTPTAAAPTVVTMTATMTGGTKSTLTFDIDAVTDSAGNVTNNITQANITDGTSVKYDPTVPVISGTAISLPTNDGYFNEGDNLDFIYQVTNGNGGDNEGIRITGTPQIALTLTSGAVTADYHAASSVLATGRLAFRYTVGASDTDADGLTFSRTITENGGTINDSSYNAIVYANALPANTNTYIIDTTAPTVVKVDTRNSVDNKTYKTGDVIRIGVVISEQVTVNTVGGTPTLELATQTGNNSLAPYAAISSNSSGNDTLFFDYTVAAGDASPDLNYASTTSIKLNGGTISDLAGNTSLLPLPNATDGTQETLGKNSDIVVDGIAPTVELVTANRAADTHWPPDSVIVVYVDFNVVVAVTTAGGTPQLTLTTKTDGSTTVLAYNTTVGGDSMSFNYTVAAGDGINTLDYAATNSLALNGGTIKDAAGNDATLTLATVGSANSLGGRRLTVDTQGPTVVSVTKDALGGQTGSAAGYYNESPHIYFHINFTDDFSTGNDIVTVNATGGTPGITVDTREDGATDPEASYIDNRGSGSIRVRYDIAHPEESAALDYVNTTSLVLNGGTIRDKAGNDATLTLPAVGGGNSLSNSVTYVVDTIDPDIERITSSAADGTYKKGDVVSIIVDMDENVYLGGFGNPNAYTAADVALLELETGNIADGTATYVSGSGNDSLVFNYIVGDNHESLDLDYRDSRPFDWNDGRRWWIIEDRAGNVWDMYAPSNPGGTNSLSQLKNLVIDGVVPTVDSVTVTTADGYYKEGDSLDVVVYGTENLYVTGTPKLTLETGDADAKVSYLSGSASKELTFRYFIAAGQNNADLDYVDAKSLTLDGGTIKDLAGNAMDTTLAVPAEANSISAANAVAVDTQAPACSLVYVNVSQSQLIRLGKGEDQLNIKAQFNEKIKATPTFNVYWPDVTDSTLRNTSFTASESADSTWTYTINSLPSETGYTGNVTFRLTATDLAGNAVATVADTSAFYLDTTPPAAFTTGAVTPLGAFPKVRWFNNGTDSLSVSFPIINSDLTLTKGKAQPRMKIHNVAGEVAVGQPDTLNNTSLPTQTIVLQKSTVTDALGATFTQMARIATWIDLYDRANNLTVGAVSLDTLTIDTIEPVMGSFVEATDLTADTLVSSDLINTTVTGFSDAHSGLATFEFAVGKHKDARYTELDSMLAWTEWTSNTDSVISGAAPLRHATDHRVSVRGLDNAGNRSDTLTTLDPGLHRLNSAPVILDGGLVEIKEEVPLSFFLQATDVDIETLLSDTLSYQFTDLNDETVSTDSLLLRTGSPKIAINQNTGEITWATPYHGSTTEYTIPVKVIDNTSVHTIGSFPLRVKLNEKPRYNELAYIKTTGDSVKTGLVPKIEDLWENDTLVIAFTIDDQDDDTLKYSITADSSNLKVLYSDSTIYQTPDTVQVMFVPAPFWTKESRVKLSVSDGTVNNAVRTIDTTFVMDIKRVPRPQYTLSLGQNPSFTRYYELMVTDPEEKAKNLEMYIFKDQTVPVGAVEMKSLGLYTWVGNFEFDTTAHYRFEMKGDGLVGDTTVYDTATHALARANRPWQASSYDGGFRVTAKSANAVPFDKPFMIVDSLLFEVGEAEGGLYRMGHPLVEFDRPVMVTIAASEQFNPDDQAIYQMIGGIWEELPTIAKKGEIMAWTSSMGYFKIGDKNIEGPEETLLGNNYPNPFNSSTNVEFDIGFFGGPEQRVHVAVYNILGQRVKTLHEGPLAIGHHSLRWNGRDIRESPVSSGIYVIRLVSDAGISQSKKMTLVR